MSKQQEQSAQVKQVEQEEQLQPIDYDTSTNEENELLVEANTTENEDVEPPESKIQEQPEPVAQPTVPDQEVSQGRPQRNRHPPDYFRYNRFGSPYYTQRLPFNLRTI